MPSNDNKLKEKAYTILKRKGQKFSEKFKNSELYELLDEIEIYSKELEEEKKELIKKEKSLITKTKELNKENEENYKEVFYSLIEMLEKRDPYTAGHSDRVAKYSNKIAQKLKLSVKECELVYEASMLHDMGKIVIPDAILLNPDKLNKLEYELIQEHASIGADLLENIKNFKAIAKIIRYHHERENGSGYPEGLKSKEIPLLSKIIAVADSFDAMTTSRVYSNVKSKEEALMEISSYSNILYDEKVVKAAVDVLKDEVIDININQDPTSHMDKARFSYFYKDQLTGLYNKNYLECFIKTDYLKQYKYLNTISIRSFSKYNLKYSWDKGDVFLKDLAEELVHIFKKDELFRVKGDNFYILSKDKNSLNMDNLNKKLKNDLISFEFNSYILEDYKIKSLRDILSIKKEKSK